MDANGGALISDGSIRNNGILHGGYALYVTDGAAYRGLLVTSVIGGDTGAIYNYQGVNLGSNACIPGPC